MKHHKVGKKKKKILIEDRIEAKVWFDPIWKTGIKQNKLR
jgi:hypothetical protein